MQARKGVLSETIYQGTYLRPSPAYELHWSAYKASYLV